MKKINITTKEQARNYAIKWQQWANEQNPIDAIADNCKLYQGDLVEWGAYFTELAERFDLTEEFRENGII